MAYIENRARVSYRYRPSGEHKYRLLALRPLAKPMGARLVYSDEVQERSLQRRGDSPRSGFGATPKQTRFGKLAKERVRDACAILDKTFGERCLFTTGTIPGSTRESFLAVAQWSGYLVQTLKQWLADNFVKVRAVYVWEFQKRGALHLHCCFGASNKRELERLRIAWHDRWCELLERVCEKSGVDVFAREDGHTWRYLSEYVRTDSQWVKNSVGRYLSKYLSKQAASVADSGFWCPSRWWGVDNWLRAETLRQTICVLSKVQPYMVAKKMFEELTVALSLISEKFYGWKNRYNPFERTCVCFLQQSG